jgi:hypothetical protein
MPSPAAELREAATLLRDTATAAIHEDRRTWSTGNTLGSKSPVIVDDQEQPSVLIETYAARLEAVNRYLALLGPATGIALAKLLERQSRAAAEVEQFLGAAADEAMAIVQPELEKLQTRVAELEQVARGYCPECGRGDCAPTVEHWDRERKRAKQAESDLAEARMWARHGYEIGQRSCTWADHGVAPAWLTDPQATTTEAS